MIVSLLLPILLQIGQEPQHVKDAIIQDSSKLHGQEADRECGAWLSTALAVASWLSRY